MFCCFHTNVTKHYFLIFPKDDEDFTSRRARWIITADRKKFIPINIAVNINPIDWNQK